MRRILHYWAVIRVFGWVYIAPIFVTFLPWLGSVRDEFMPPDVAARLKMPQWLPHWPWYFWTIAALCVLILLILEGSYRLDRDLRSKLTDQSVPIGDMHIRDAFFQRDEGALENETWLKIGKDLHDLLSQGALKAWGRKAGQRGDAPLEEISKDYWKDAKFTYFFFHEGSDQGIHAQSDVGMHIPNYRDVRLNRQQVLFYWPVPKPKREATYNIDAKAAFSLVLRKSTWARFWAEGEEQLVIRLKQEFRNHLINAKLTAWGKSSRVSGLKRISPDKWDTMELWLEPPFSEENTYTTTQAPVGGKIVTVPFIDVKLCREEVLRLYPLKVSGGS
jgi:hypothetical protein